MTGRPYSQESLGERDCPVASEYQVHFLEVFRESIILASNIWIWAYLIFFRMTHEGVNEMRCKKSTKWSLRLSSKLCYKDVHNWPKTDVNSKCSHQDCLYDSRSVAYHTDGLRNRSTRVVPKVISNVFLLANWEQQTKESAVVDRTSCCVILECLMTSIACDT